MDQELAHFFSVKEHGSKHWQLTSYECYEGEEDLDAERQREMAEWIRKTFYPAGEVKYLATAVAAETLKRLPRKP